MLHAFPTSFPGAVDPEAHVQKHRHTWQSRVEFVFFTLGFVVGIGNLWRFPYLCGRYGGGAFVFVYLCCLVLVAAPLWFYECVLGQATQRGPPGALKMVHPWSHNLCFYAVFVLAAIASYYFPIVAWAAFYLYQALVALFKGTNLAWHDASEQATYGAEVKEALVNTFLKTVAEAPVTAADSDAAITTAPESKAVYELNDSGELIASILSDDFKIGEFTRKPTNAAKYFDNSVLQKSVDIEHTETIVWQIALSCLIMYALAVLALSGGVHAAGKVAVVTFALPCIMMIVLFFRVIWLPGVKEGLYYYVVPDWKRVLDVEVWIQACGQIAFSLGGGNTVGIALASYHKRDYPHIVGDALIVACGNSLFSIFGGFVIFGVIGNMVYQRRQAFDTALASVLESTHLEAVNASTLASDDAAGASAAGSGAVTAENVAAAFKRQHPELAPPTIDELSKAGPALPFEIFAEALTNFHPIFAVFFFATIVFMGVDTGHAYMQTIVTSATDLVCRLKPSLIAVDEEPGVLVPGDDGDDSETSTPIVVDLPAPEANTQQEPTTLTPIPEDEACDNKKNEEPLSEAELKTKKRLKLVNLVLLLIIGTLLCAVSIALYATKAGYYFVDLIDHYVTYAALISNCVETFSIGWLMSSSRMLRAMVSVAPQLKGRTWILKCFRIQMKFIGPFFVGMLIVSAFYNEFNKNSKQVMKNPAGHYVYQGYPSAHCFLGWMTVIVPVLVLVPRTKYFWTFAWVPEMLQGLRRRADSVRRSNAEDL